MVPTVVGVAKGGNVDRPLDCAADIMSRSAQPWGTHRIVSATTPRRYTDSGKRQLRDILTSCHFLFKAVILNSGHCSLWEADVQGSGVAMRRRWASAIVLTKRGIWGIMAGIFRQIIDGG